MKRLILLTAVIALAGCASSHKRDEAKNPPPTPAQQAAANMATDRDQYVQRTQARIDELSKFAGDLRTKADTAQRPQKKKLQNAADDMDSSLKDVTKSLDEVKTAAPENWLDYKRDVTKSMQTAETQYSNSVRLLQ